MTAMTPVVQEPNRVRRAADVVLVAMFAVSLLAPFVDRLVRADEARGPGPELRVAAPCPDWPGSPVDALQFPRSFEKYWSDSFGLRDVLLRWHSIVKVLCFGVSPDDRHVIGKDGWIFNDVSAIVDNWRGVIPFDEARLAAWQSRLERRRDAVRRLGAHYLFAIAPDKPQIYPDFMPNRLNKVGPSRMDQLFDRLRAHSTVDFLDLRPALVAEREHDAPGDHVYYELGSHWQARGAIAGYNAFAVHLRSLQPPLREWAMSEHMPIPKSEPGDTEARNMYIGDLIPQTDHWWMLRPSGRSRRVATADKPRSRSYECDDPALPRIVMFHDSFGPYFETQWAESCARLAMVWSYDFDLGLIRRERPDLVVEFIVERTLVFQDPSRLTEHEVDAVETRFQAASQALLRLDPTQDALRPVLGGSCRPDRDDAGPFVRLQTLAALDPFLIDHPPQIVGRELVARIDLDVPARGKLKLYWKAPGSPWAGGSDVPLLPGFNTTYVEVPAQAAPLEGLALQPFDGPAECRLRALEIRDVGPPADAAAR